MARQVDIHPPQVERSNEKLASGKGNQSYGHECEFIQPPPEAFQTDCSICLLVLREPHLISCCGQSFCQTCIGRIKTDGKSCPLCNATDFTVMHNKGLERSLKEFDVRCTYATSRCEWVGKLGLLDNHLNLNPDLEKQLEGCGYVDIACNHKCGGVVPRRMLANHQGEECHKRSYSCDYCREYASTFEDVMNNHWPECKCYPLSCPNQCTPYAIERQHFADHLRNDCPLTVVDCDFHYAGCEVQLPRKDVPAHLAENLVIHMSLLATQSQNENVKLKEELVDFHRKLEVQHEEMDQQSQKISRKNVKLKEELAHFCQKLEVQRKGMDQQSQKENAKLKEELAHFRQKLEVQRKEMDQQSQKENAKLKEELAHFRQKLEVQHKVMDQHRQQGLGVVGLIGFGVLVLAIILSNFGPKLASMHQEIELFKRQMNHFEHKMERVHARKEESTTQRQEIDRSREEKAAMKQEIQLQMDQLKKKQATDAKSLIQDMTNMREKQEQDRTELERQATTIQHVNAHIRLPVVPFQITMPDFETHKAADDKWYSEPFYTHPGGYKMCLKVYANGYVIGKQTHIAVYVYLMRGMFDEHLKWPLLCDITIELLNQKENKQHRTVINFGSRWNAAATHRVTETERAVSGWGYYDFISHAELYSHHDNFINNGSISFQITKIELKE